MSIEKSNNILDDVRHTLRRLHYSIHTEKAYCDWGVLGTQYLIMRY